MGVALSFHGRGGDLGNFEVFAASLATQLKRAGRNAKVLRVERRDEFFDQLLSPPLAPGDEIDELHIFAHSIGGGLFLGYGDTSLNDRRNIALLRAKESARRLTYEEVLELEAGAVLTDDLTREPYLSYRPSIARYFAPKAMVKI